MAAPGHISRRGLDRHPYQFPSQASTIDTGKESLDASGYNVLVSVVDILGQWIRQLRQDSGQVCSERRPCTEWYQDPGHLRRCCGRHRRHLSLVFGYRGG